MRVCSLQLERGETKDLAPTGGATGPMVLSGGAITTVTYRVFDKTADRIDKAIRNEPWRAFAEVTMRVTLDRDPEFEVKLDGVEVEPTDRHRSPGLTLISHLSTYFPLLPRAYVGATYSPDGAA